MSLRLLAGEEKAQLVASLVDSYGIDDSSLERCELLEGDGDFWAVSPTVITLPLRKLRTDSIGILLARSKGGDLEPTVAALQLFARPRVDSILLTQAQAAAFIDRKIVTVNAPDGRHVVFLNDRALDLGRVREGRLMRVESGKPARKP